MKKTGFGFQALIAWAVLWALTPALAQPNDDPSSDRATPPRLAVSEGDVQFWRPGAARWEPAQINTALAEGDALNAGSDGTVELQVGPRDFVRLPANTLLIFEEYDPSILRFRLVEGTASFDLRGGGGQLVRIDTDYVNISVASLGYYRILVHQGETRITVRNNGRATITLADGSSRSIAAGEEISIENGGRVNSHAAPAPDAWDNWNDARSDYYGASTSYRYVSPDVYGAADLDYHGSWREDNTYGAVWMPAVAPGWAPYSRGYWRSDPYYGWTWVDVELWGWTTSHYGRWVRIGSAWGWAPGPRRARVTYAPALVAFFNGGGGMGWVALGWGEPLLPWWGQPSFRGTVWWGGWSGPRVTYQPTTYVYRNTVVTTAVVTVRTNDFGRGAVRGSNFSAPSGVRMQPVRGTLPVRYAPAQPVRRDVIPPRPAPTRTTGHAATASPAAHQPGGRVTAPATTFAPTTQPHPTAPTPTTRPASAAPSSATQSHPGASTPTTRPAPTASSPAMQPHPTAPAPATRPAPSAPSPTMQPHPTAPAPTTRPAPSAPSPAIQSRPTAPAPTASPRPQTQSQSPRSSGSSSSSSRGSSSFDRDSSSSSSGGRGGSGSSGSFGGGGFNRR